MYPRTYLTHDNGGTAFAVDVHRYKIEVYRMFGEYSGGRVLQTKYTKKWIGDNLLKDSNYQPKGRCPGNSVLIEITPGNYIHVGSEVFYFKTRNQEPILKYVSPVGNSDVPYPYAIGKNYTYFMLDKETIPNYNLNLKQDAYSQFYGSNLEKKQQQILNHSKKKFRTKTLAKRMLDRHVSIIQIN